MIGLVPGEVVIETRLLNNKYSKATFPKERGSLSHWTNQSNEVVFFSKSLLIESKGLSDNSSLPAGENLTAIFFFMPNQAFRIFSCVSPLGLNENSESTSFVFPRSFSSGDNSRRASQDNEKTLYLSLIRDWRFRTSSLILPLWNFQPSVKTQARRSGLS
ncbi:hypothetical protein, partial [Parasutterella sp.]|uniref:hypothetical protein n=1 Tax=Parasutterella sp. TaxID=2049037 RepID=UPI003AF1A771